MTKKKTTTTYKRKGPYRKRSDDEEFNAEEFLYAPSSIRDTDAEAIFDNPAFVEAKRSAEDMFRRHPAFHIRPTDDLKSALKKFPCPKRGVIFECMWNSFILDVTERENFKPGHLHQLSILCDMYEEHEILTSFISDNGYTFQLRGGRYGPQTKTYPEVQQLQRVRAEIRNYSKVLGLILFKDKDTSAEDEVKNEWLE